MIPFNLQSKFLPTSHFTSITLPSSTCMIILPPQENTSTDDRQLLLIILEGKGNLRDNYCKSTQKPG